MTLQWLGILSAIIAVNVVLWLVSRLLFSRFFRPSKNRAIEARCRCGYILKGLQSPRCPECGRAIGFDKTFEELGLSADEMRSLKNAASPKSRHMQ
jgi:hypothetical protein